MKPVAVLACCIAAALTGCAASTSSADAVPATPSRHARERAAIRGMATYVERVKMPPGASLRVELLDAASGAPITTALLRDIAGPPVPFTITRPDGPAPSGGYALRAALLGPGGERWFETPAPVAAPLGTDAVELRMRHVAGGEPVVMPALRGVAHWECGELGVMSRFAASARTVRLSFNGRALVLPIARSGVGRALRRRSRQRVLDEGRDRPSHARRRAGA